MHFFNEDNNRELRRTRNEVASYLEYETRILRNEVELLERKMIEYSEKIEKPLREGIIGKMDFLICLYLKIKSYKLKSLLQKKQQILSELLDSFDERLHDESQKKLQEFLEEKNTFIKTIKPLKA